MRNDKITFDIKVTSRILEDLKTIELIHDLGKMANRKHVLLMDTSEKMVREKLIELGWTPPVVNCSTCEYGIEIRGVSCPYVWRCDDKFSGHQPLKPKPKPEPCETCNDDKRITAQQLMAMKTASLTSSTLLYKGKRRRKAWRVKAQHNGRFFLVTHTESCVRSVKEIWTDCPDCLGVKK
jgi:hypothetical protein